MKYLHTILASLAAGMLAGLVVNGVWLLLVGSPPSLTTALVASQAVTAAWAIGTAVRFQRKWQNVLDAYERPAFGAGIDVPHRPPADDDGSSS